MMSRKKLVNVKIIIRSFIVQPIKYDIQQFHQIFLQEFLSTRLGSSFNLERWPTNARKLNTYGHEEIKSSKMRWFDITVAATDVVMIVAENDQKRHHVSKHGPSATETGMCRVSNGGRFIMTIVLSPGPAWSLVPVLTFSGVAISEEDLQIVLKEVYS